MALYEYTKVLLIFALDGLTKVMQISVFHCAALLVQVVRIAQVRLQAERKKEDQSLYLPSKSLIAFWLIANLVQLCIYYTILPVGLYDPPPSRAYTISTLFSLFLLMESGSPPPPPLYAGVTL